MSTRPIRIQHFIKHSLHVKGQPKHLLQKIEREGLKNKRKHGVLLLLNGKPVIMSAESAALETTRNCGSLLLLNDHQYEGSTKSDQFN